MDNCGVYKIISKIVFFLEPYTLSFLFYSRQLFYIPNFQYVGHFFFSLSQFSIRRDQNTKKNIVLVISKFMSKFFQSLSSLFFFDKTSNCEIFANYINITVCFVYYRLFISLASEWRWTKTSNRTWHVSFRFGIVYRESYANERIECDQGNFWHGLA